ncbi:hypothetical protein Har1130_10005 [Haloarcula sp. CBA1130]|uniref:DUF7537 family lipoprotein n=1 Tax=unclassified Haloarcula TaxID=2624677 RepID=UPI00124409CE|nr:MULTISPECIES: hypothetical protein [unclassified Haloarcula]KAA9398544.1 hypothetical protein Har1129_10100 [Haloarcula sp. CBA1129]KAA9403060.1 hypothetical protein Har1130_10005 [Haloarcula sp. CBA1130]
MLLERRHLSLALVVLLTASAGCSGLLGTESGTGGTGAEATATSTDANGPAPGSSGFDATAIERGHFETLSNSSFTTSVSFQLSTVRDGENRSVFINRTVAIDRETGRALSMGELVQASGDTLATTTYTADGTTAERRVLTRRDNTMTDYRSASPPYDGPVQPVNESSVIDRSLLQSLGSDINWTYTGTETVDGDSVSRFEATGSAVTGFAADDAVSTNVSANGTTDSASATVLVDEDGVVRSFQYRVTTVRDGRPVTVTLSLSVSQVDDTAVTEPGWLSNA